MLKSKWLTLTLRNPMLFWDQWGTLGYLMNTANKSLLDSTGQTWKYRASSILGAVSVCSIISAIALFSIDEQQFGFLFMLGGAGAVMSLAIPLSIKCPKCNSRWYFEALNQRIGSRSLDKFRTQAVCPVCGFTSDKTT